MNLEQAREIIGGLETLANWRPTAFDCPGLGSEGRETFRVLPLIRTRDSQALEQSNFRVALEALQSDDVDPDCSGHEVLRFGHWGPGWLEILVIDPAHEPVVIEAARIVAALADYPVLDEADLGQFCEHCDAELDDCACSRCQECGTVYDEPNRAIDLDPCSNCGADIAYLEHGDDLISDLEWELDTGIGDGFELEHGQWYLCGAGVLSPDEADAQLSMPDIDERKAATGWRYAIAGQRYQFERYLVDAIEALQWDAEECEAA